MEVLGLSGERARNFYYSVKRVGKAMNLEIAVERGEDLVVLVPTGRLDTNTAKLLEERVTEATAADTHLVIDMEGVDYVSSFGLRVILMAAKTYAQKSKSLVLCGLQKDVMNVFRISGFLKILTVVENRAAARDALNDA